MEELHPEVTWKAPSLFANDYAALTLAKSLAPRLGRPLFQVAYGAPASAWSGGRPPRVTRTLSEGELRAYFCAYQELGIRCALTLTRPDCARLLDDAYCNLLLALVDEYEGQVIVADEALAHYIRHTHPTISLVASNNLCVRAYWSGFGGLGTEANLCRALLETFDEVVIRTEAIWEEGTLDALADVADRIELLVNQHCVRGCECALEHMRLNEELIAQGSLATSVCPWRRRHGEEAAKERGTTFVDEIERDGLCARGFTKWKLGGRSKGSREFSLRLLMAVFGRRGLRELLEGDEARTDELAPILWQNSRDPMLCTRIP